MRKLLLHTCCGPCGTSCFERLLNEGEWEKRLGEVRKVVDFFKSEELRVKSEEKEMNFAEQNSEETTPSPLATPLRRGEFIDLVVPEQNVDEFVDGVKGMEGEPEGGKRCEVCFRMRLAKTAEYARDNGFDAFGTTLTVSPHKNAELINRIGRELEREFGATFLERDFKKGNGYLRSLEICKALGVYRQKYCGCLLN